jgi:glycerol-3-phosphate dehydrogenase
MPIISVSKGIEVTSGQLMSEVIPSVLGKKQPTVYLSGEGCQHATSRQEQARLLWASPHGWLQGHSSCAATCSWQRRGWPA